MKTKPRSKVDPRQVDLFSNVLELTTLTTSTVKPNNEHELYGVELVCGECGGTTIIAKHFTRATGPSSVQARCRKLSCKWVGVIKSVGSH